MSADSTNDNKILGYEQPGQFSGALKQAQGAAYQVRRRRPRT